ncbi:TetR/AcrR family transcriptional regulator [Pseudogemmobacter sonorensis]|uniref:TetR/AcrR family transcriptional regulator n=1 Tax=Pseudogemmobacter sonorensis TaxID=2989681 RepID=UPI0036767A1D
MSDRIAEARAAETSAAGSSPRVAPRNRRPGRPEGQTKLADEILDAAEVLFAEQGYAGTTLRQVAERLGVTPAMIAYYFQNKDNLFRDVFTRRGKRIASQRMERLAQLQARGGYEVEDLVRAFIQPSAELFGDDQGRAFLKLHARLHMEPESLSFELRSLVYNESTRAYADAFAALLPGVSRREVFQRVSLLVGAYLYAYSGTSRLDDLLGEAGGTVTEGMFETIVAFGTAGMARR